MLKKKKQLISCLNLVTSVRMGCGGQRLVAGTFTHCCPPSFSQTGSFLKSGVGRSGLAGQAVTSRDDPPVCTCPPHSTEISDVHSHALGAVYLTTGP